IGPGLLPPGDVTQPCAYVLSCLPRPPPRSTLFPYTTLFRSRVRSRRTSPKERPRLTSGTPTSSAPPSTPPACTISSRPAPRKSRSEEHTSELQSRFDLVCRLLLAKKNMGARTVDAPRRTARP